MLFMSRIEDIDAIISVPYNSDIDVFNQVVNQIHKVDTELTRMWNYYTILAIYGKCAERINTHYGSRSVKNINHWRVVLISVRKYLKMQVLFYLIVHILVMIRIRIILLSIVYLSLTISLPFSLPIRSSKERIWCVLFITIKLILISVFMVKH